MNNKPPIIISGLGGSGTRVVAEIFMHVGVFLGSDLNNSLDNLFFTFLFKHPHKFTFPNSQQASLVHQLFDVHHKILLRNESMTVNDLRWLAWAGLQHGIHRIYYNWRWVASRWYKIFIAKHKTIKPASSWGWKEPHVVYFLPQLLEFYPEAKFVFLIRHGLDMAFTRNDQQFRHWPLYYGEKNFVRIPRAMFDYWYQFNKYALGIAEQQLGKERFHVVKLENLYGVNKHEHIIRLLKYIDIDDVPDDVLRIPQVPTSANRYLKHDISWIDAEVEQKLTEFGYSVNLA